MKIKQGGSEDEYYTAIQFRDIGTQTKLPTIPCQRPATHYSVYGGLIVAGMDGIFLGNVLFWFSLAIAMCLVYRCFYLKSMSYTFTAEQIIYEHGVFKRTRDYCEMYRIIDFREESSFLQQIFGLKTATIYSGDRSTPRLDIIGIGSKDNIIPVVRERVTANRKRHGIYEITNR